MKLSRAQQNRLLKLAERGRWSDSMAERELALFDALVEAGFATKKMADRHVVADVWDYWLVYTVTDAGKQEAERLKLECEMKGLVR